MADPPLVPPSCDPTVSGVGVPGCPSTLLGEAGDIQNPAVALPDLSPDVTEVYVGYEWVDFIKNTWVFGPAILSFNTISQNIGTVPVDLRNDDPTALPSPPVSQCVSWTTNLVCRRRQPVGGFTWHDEHKHFHFQDFAAYELRRLDANGDPDFSAQGLLGSSPKVSFCLIDSRRVREDASPVSRYNTCNPVEEGISAGWADEYTAGIEGQSLSLRGLADGTYALVIAMNGSQHLMETTASNNRIVATVLIHGLGTWDVQATILDKRLI